MTHGRIAPQSLEYVKNNASIVDVVQAFTALKPSGKSHTGRCPFHNEKTPSFHVNEREGLYYCFGCQKGGDTISFVRDMLRVEFVEAVEWIAQRMGYKLEYVTNVAPGTPDPMDGLRRVSEVAAQWFQSCLEKHAPAKKQLVDRGMTDELIRAFRLGYAPESWDALRTELIRQRCKVEDAVGTGLLKNSERGGAPYAIFRDRLMIPVTDRKGQVVAFGGRQCSQSDDKKSPKYINSPESPLFHKSEIFFGGPFWEQTVLQHKQIILVEGYFDVISLWGKGFKNTVAVMGLGLTSKHLTWIKQKQLDVILMLDGDEAGLRASQRLLPLFLEAGVFAREFVLPTGEDPDTYAMKQTEDALKKSLDAAPMHFDSVAQRLLKQGQGTIQGEIQSAKQVMALIACIADPMVREVRMKYLAERLGLSLDELRKSLQKTSQGESRKSVTTEASKGAPSSGMEKILNRATTTVKAGEERKDPSQPSSAEIRLLELLALRPARLSEPLLLQAKDWCRSERVRQAVEELLKFWQQLGYDSGDEPVGERERLFLQFLRNHWGEQPDKLNWLAKVRAADEAIPPVESAPSDRDFHDCVTHLKEQELKRESREALYALKSMSPDKNWDQVEELMKQQLLRAQMRHGIREV